MTATDIAPADTAPTPAGTAPAEASGPENENALAAKILLTVLVLLAGWATSVATWGIPGLYIPALAMVPVIWVLLLVISRV